VRDEARGERAAGGGNLEERLVILMGARLALAALSFGIALFLDLAGERVGIPVQRGFYAIVAFAFLATAAYGALLPRVRRPRVFAAVNVGTDIGIVTALVAFSGGSESVFSFLYLLVAVYGGVLFDLRGALATACLGAATYGAVLVAGTQGWIRAPVSDPAVGPAELASAWGVHAGALLLVAALGSFLFAELQRTGAALDQRTDDLRRLRSLHERTVESLMSGLLTTDREGAITSFNPEAERITGVPAARALGRSLWEVLPGVAEAALPGGVRSTELRVRTRTPYRNEHGEELHLGVAAYYLRDAEGRPDGHIVIFQDVTGVVRMEAELRRSERLAAVGRLAASIAHEVRNPLAAISGSIQMMQRQLPEPPEGEGGSRRLMDIVLRETDRLNQLIGDFLGYARPGPLQLECVDLAFVVEDVLKMFEGSRPEGVAVRCEVRRGRCVRADPAQLRQVLWNLVLNAAQAMPEGGELAVTARPVEAAAPQEAPAAGRKAGEQGPGAGVELAVSDRGVGIQPEALEHVFDPFFTTKREGSGLGLATVHRIVEGHGGSIQVESRVGRGTTVRLRLPAAETTAQEAGEEA